jgi:hypothetical protein
MGCNSPFFCQSFNSRDLYAIRLNRQSGTGFNGHAIHVDRASSALGCVASNVCSGQTDFFPDKINQQHTRFDLFLMNPTVHGNTDTYSHRNTSLC